VRRKAPVVRAAATMTLSWAGNRNSAAVEQSTSLEAVRATAVGDASAVAPEIEGHHREAQSFEPDTKNRGCLLQRETLSLC